MNSLSEREATQYWNRLLKPYSVPDDRKAWFQVITTSILFALNWALMYFSLSGPYWVTILLAVPAAGLMVRLFIFQHDCGHGSFFSSRKLNDAVGGLIGVLMLTPYTYWKRTHAIHHATSGDLDRRSLGDVETLTVDEYLALSWKGKVGYRLYRNPFILMTIGPVFQFLLKHRFPYDIPRSWKREWASVLWTNVGIALVLLLAWQTIGLKAFFLVQLPTTLIAISAGMWLFYIQHQFEDTYWRDHPEWNFHRAGIEGSSFYDLPQIVHWFTGNIGYHHIHHLASRIPNYRLQDCYREVEALHEVTKMTFWESLACARLALWDREGGRLVSFGYLRRLRGAEG